MTRRAAILLTLLLAPIPLAAQDIPVGPRLLRVLSSSTGIVLSIDSLTVARTGDSTFVANTVYDYPADSAQAVAANHIEEWQEMDCGHLRLRGRNTIRGDPAHPFAMLYDTTTPSRAWQPVPEDELPIFQAVCTWLLGSFAASLPVAHETEELWNVEEPPSLVNRAEVAQGLSRVYPRELYRQHIGGRVMVRFQVTPEGRADSATARVLWASRREFGLAALSLVQRMRFHPARNHGVPVPVWVTLPIAFDSGR